MRCFYYYGYNKPEWRGYKVFSRPGGPITITDFNFILIHQYENIVNN